MAQDLAAQGWSHEAVLTDKGSEFRSADFVSTVTRLGAGHRTIRAGRPQTNGCVERVQLTILAECWKPAFARCLIPEMTGLSRDLTAYLEYFPERPRGSCVTTRAPTGPGERHGSIGSGRRGAIAHRQNC